MLLFGVMGWSGSGKTTLLEQVIPLIKGAGLTVSSMKHSHHKMDVDKKGKDSYRHRDAGASEVIVASAFRWALMHEYHGQHDVNFEPDVQELASHMSPCDVVLVEGFKTQRLPKMEIFRKPVGRGYIFGSDDTQAAEGIVAIASDVVEETSRDVAKIAQAMSVPAPAVVDLNNAQAVADFVVGWVRKQQE